MNGLINLLRKWVSKLLPRHNVEKEMSVQIAVSSKMDEAIQLWKDMYENLPPWNAEEDTVCTNLPATISEEMARLILTEFKMEVTGSDLGDFINEQLKRELLVDIDSYVERFCAKGGIVLKPYVSADAQGNPSKIEIDVVDADRFFPTAYNGKGEVSSAVFVQYKREGEYLYTRLEYHEMNGSEIIIINKAFRSEKIFNYGEDDPVINEPLKEEVPLDTIPEWSGLSREPVVIKNMDKPLFVYIKTGAANNIDTSSPLGISIYARAVELIHEADKIFGKIVWEFDATEAAIHVSNEYLDMDKQGQPILPKGKERLYRGFDASSETKLFDIFSPEIRENPLFSGLNKILKRIEWTVGFSYGTISDPNELEKTAEEIRSSKQRSFRTVTRMQNRWDIGIKNLVESMEALIHLYGIMPTGKCEVSCTWGDGVLEDVEKEYQRRWAMVMANKLKPEKFMSWYFGVPEDEVRELIPNEEPFPDME